MFDPITSGGQIRMFDDLLPVVLGKSPTSRPIARHQQPFRRVRGGRREVLGVITTFAAPVVTVNPPGQLGTCEHSEKYKSIGATKRMFENFSKSTSAWRQARAPDRPALSSLVSHARSSG